MFYCITNHINTNIENIFIIMYTYIVAEWSNYKFYLGGCGFSFNINENEKEIQNVSPAVGKNSNGCCLCLLSGM